VQQLSRDLNAVYRRTPVLWELDASPEGFRWIDANDAQGNVLVLPPLPGRVPGRGLRGFLGLRGPAGAVRGDRLPANFAAIPHRDYRIGLPPAGRGARS